MQYTNNNGLIIKEKTDNYSRENFNKCMNIIDDGLCKFYVATLESANTYKVTTGLNKTVLNDGYSIKVAIPSNSTGAVSIIVDNITVPLKQVNGNDVTNLKANGVYSLTYYNSVFILASGGGADTVNFTSDKLLTGYSANDSNGEKIDGTMTNNGAISTTLNCGGSYTIPKGYHNGQGKVTANSLASQTTKTGTAVPTVSVYGTSTVSINNIGFIPDFVVITGTATITNTSTQEEKTVPIVVTVTRSTGTYSYKWSSGYAYIESITVNSASLSNIKILYDSFSYEHTLTIGTLTWKAYKIS